MRSTRTMLTVGLMNPMGFLPIARRASLMAESMDALTGDDAEVPNTRLNSPLTATT